MSESEALGAYRAATLIRLSELRDNMVKQIESIIRQKDDSYDRTCSVLALQRVQDLWRIAIGDFEISIGHTVDEIQMQSLAKEKERLTTRLQHLFETTENLYRLILGPLPPDVSDDMTLVTRLNVECKHLRKNLVENQHKLLASPKQLDFEHISLKQLWKVAQNALQVAARNSAFETRGGNNNNNETSKNNKQDDSHQQQQQQQQNENSNNDELTLEGYKREIGASREIYDLRLQLR